MKTFLCVFVLVIVSGVSLGSSFWVSVEVERENLFPVQDADYLKTIFPQYRDLLNGMIAAQREGKTVWYELQIGVDSWDDRILSAVLYKPDGTSFAMRRDSDYEFEFESDEQFPERLFTSLAELASEFPSGVYRVEVAFAAGGTAFREFLLPDLSGGSFPEFADVSLSEDTSGQLIFHWGTVENASFYNVWAEALRKNGFDEIYDADYDSLTHPQTFSSALGIYKSKGDYQIGLCIEGNRYWGNGYDIQFLTDVTLFSFKKPALPAEDKIAKCSVKSGVLDSIAFSGQLQAYESDYQAGQAVVVSLTADAMPLPAVFEFPITAGSMKNGKFSGSYTDAGSSGSFSYDSRSHAFSFSGKGDLTGLACPIRVEIFIGGNVSTQIEMGEAIVNGTKPCPPELLMWAVDWMQVDKASVKRGKKAGTDSLSVSGFFAVSDDYDKANPLVMTLGGQTFTVSGSQFTNKGLSESCSKGICQEGARMKAKFDFAKGTFQIQLQNVSLDDSGPVDFGINCFGHTLPEGTITLPQ